MSTGILFLGLSFFWGLAHSQTLIDIRETNVTIASPSFPYNYPPNSSVEWRIFPSALTNFTIEVTDLSMERSDGCKFDSLVVMDPYQNDPLFGPLCGNKNETRTTSMLSYGFSVQFRSDLMNESRGFTLQISGFPVPEHHICDVLHDQATGRLSSDHVGAGGRYPTNLNCSWITSTSIEEQIVIHFSKFNIEFSGPDCVFDRLEIWDISRESIEGGEKLLAKICGRRERWTMSTFSNKIRMSLYFDSHDNVGSFSILYYPDYRIIDADTRPVHHMKATPVFQTTPLGEFELAGSLRINFRLRTHPGFKLNVYMPTRESVGVLFFDGPDTTFVQVCTGYKYCESSGFHLFVSVSLARDESLKHEYVTFHSVKAIPVIFSPVIADVSILNHTLPFLTYFQIVAKPDSRLDVTLLEDLFGNRSNIDNCAYSGLAIYAGELEFDNLVGPFCGINTNYVKRLLEALTFSNRILHLCIYDYENTNIDAFLYSWYLSFPETHCSGYILSQKSLGEYKADNFVMQTSLVDGQLNINIDYGESTDNCVHVQLITHEIATRGFPILVVLNGTFSLRVCRLWEFHGENSSLTSKYDSTETCTEYKHIRKETTELTIPLTSVDGWSMEYIRLEFNTSLSVDCQHIGACPIPGKEVFQTGCGSFAAKSLNKYCTFRLVLPYDDASDTYYWYLKVNLIISNISGHHLEIWEKHSRWERDVSSRTSSRNHVRLYRPFHYYSMHGVDLAVRSVDVSILFFTFNTLKVTPVSYQLGKTPMMENCYLFHNHCYKLTHTNTTTSWRSTQDACHHSGGNLVSVNTWSELKFLKTALSTVWFDQFYANGRGLIFIGLNDMEFASDYRWVDGGTLTVTDWYYPFDEDNVLHNSPTPPINRDQIQPVADHSQRCVAMVPGNPHYSTNWRKVDCDASRYPSPVYGICEYNNTETAAAKQNPPKETFKLRCEDGWNFVHNTCLTVLTLGTINSAYYGVGDVESMCADRRGVLPRMNTIPRKLLQSFLLSKGFTSSVTDIWVRLASGGLACASVFGGYFESDNCLRTLGNRWVAVCEREPLEMKLDCLPYQFSCDDGTCLNPDRVCDLNEDCEMGEDELNCSLSELVYTCYSGDRISVFNFCDFYPDCADGSDEKGCVHPSCTDSECRCDNGQCVSLGQLCDRRGDCIDGSDENQCDWETNCDGFRCPIAGCVRKSQTEDLQADCPDKSQADEKIHHNDHTRGVFYKADNNGVLKIPFLPFALTITRKDEWDCPGHMDQIRCHRDHIKCFPADKVCVYDHDVYGQLKFCRNGAHLRHCEDFECPDMFKCPQSYCIPHHKVCDGVQDCVRGEDESSCDDRKSCPGMLRCGSTAQCVSVDRVCDGETNCKRGSFDERFCDLQNYSCPFSCTCMGYYVNCTSNQLQNIFKVDLSRNVRILDLGNNNISLSNSSFAGLTYLASLYLNENDIDSVSLGAFDHIPNLLILDLSNNNLDIIPRNTFARLQQLHTLRIQGNPLHQISEGSFRGLSSLSVLNLSGMLLDRLHPKTFVGLNGLKSLDISNNNIRQVSPDAFSSVPPLDLMTLENNSLDISDSDTFRNIDVKVLRTDSYRLCCVTGRLVGVCSPPVDQFSSCADLLPTNIIRVIVGVFAALAILGNAFVITWRLHKRLSNVPSVFIFHLSISDFLMGLYLLALSVADFSYKGVYIIHDLKWRNSVYCKIIGVMGFISCEMSMYTLVFIAVDRTKKLAFPLSTAQFLVSTAWKIECLGWIICVIFGVIPLIFPVAFGNYYGRNSICLPFNFADPTGSGWEMTTVIFVGLNTVGLLMIMFMYILILSSVKAAQKKSGRTDRIEVDVARKLSVVIVTDMACLLPIILANLMSVLGHPIDRGMASVLVTLVLPLNAALNPYLFTLNNCERPVIVKHLTQVFASISSVWKTDP